MAELAKMDFTSTQLQVLNRCRLYCHVISVSDVTDGIGHHLLLQDMTKPILWSSLYPYKWPNQGCPSQVDWNFWTQSLQTCLTSTGRALSTPLGLWSPSFLDAHPRWEYFIQDDDLWQYKNHRWFRRRRIGSTPLRHSKYPLAGTRSSFPPSHALPTRIIPTSAYLISTGTRQYQQQSLANPTYTSLFESIQSFVDSKWICQWVQEPTQIVDMALSLYQGEGLGVSDGSCHLKWDLCLAAWIIWTPAGKLRGGGTILGPAGSSTS